MQEINQRVIVTGGAGFIGSAVVRYLLAETNASVLNIDKLTYAGNLSSLDKTVSQLGDVSRYQFLQCDICDVKGVETAVDTFKPTAIMHLAAESHVDLSLIHI